MFDKHYSRLCNEIQLKGGQSFDLQDMAINTLANIILETNFGVTDAKSIAFNLSHFEKCLDNMVRRITSPILYPDFIYQKSSLYKEDVLLDEQCEIPIRKILSNREKYWKQESDTSDERRLFIDELRRYTQNNGLASTKSLEHNMFTVFMAGYETSGLTVLYTILLLAMHPEIDARVHAEISEHYTIGQEIDNELLKRLTYLDMVIKESMRLFPPAPTSARQNLKPVYIGKYVWVFSYIRHVFCLAHVSLKIYKLQSRGEKHATRLPYSLTLLRRFLILLRRFFVFYLCMTVSIYTK